MADGAGMEVTGLEEFANILIGLSHFGSDAGESAVVGTALDYAYLLEHGGGGHSPRPAFQLAVEQLGVEWGQQYGDTGAFTSSRIWRLLADSKLPISIAHRISTLWTRNIISMNIIDTTAYLKSVRVAHTVEQVYDMSVAAALKANPKLARKYGA